jgi:hypothetical protein
VMQAGFFSRYSPELLLEVVDEDDRTTRSVRSRADDRDGRVAGWPKSSQREKRVKVLSSSKGNETW